MKMLLQRAEFGPDRQFADVAVQVPDRRPGWAVVMQAKGATPVVMPRQACVMQDDGSAYVRFYPFLSAGEYTLLTRLIPPEIDVKSQQGKPSPQRAMEIGRASVPPLDIAAAAQWLQSEGADLSQAASRALLPLCVDPHGVPCFWPFKGSSPRRVVVLSVPKAGTYLVSKLIENLGMVNCNMHVGRNAVSDFRLSKRMPSPAKRYLDIAYSSRLVLAGQSMASHMSRDPATEVSLFDFQKIFVFRDLRAALVSAFRAEGTALQKRPPMTSTETPSSLQDDSQQVGHKGEEFANFLERGHVERLSKRYATVARWYDHPDVCRVSFEAIMGDHGPAERLKVVIAVAARCGVDISDEEAQALLDKTVGSETQTYSGSRSSVSEYWTPKAEDMFRQAGLDKLNAMLGYDAH